MIETQSSQMMICPRCYASSSIVCCALCRDERKVNQSLYASYTALKSKTVGKTIQLRENMKTKKMLAINARGETNMFCHD